MYDVSVIIESQKKKFIVLKFFYAPPIHLTKYNIFVKILGWKKRKMKWRV